MALARRLLKPLATREGGFAMMSISRRSFRGWRVLRWVGLGAGAAALWACTSRTLEMPNTVPQAVTTQTITQKINNKIDLLFMIDNSSSMTEMQGKLYDQLPSFMNILTSLTPSPSLHVAVVSSDMGAPGDSTQSISCTVNGDNGVFQSSPRSNSTLNPPVVCTDTTLATPAGAADDNHTYISNADGMPNFTDPIDKVFQCIALLGDKGCGFEHQLASIDHALGSDNFQPDPNTGALVPTPPASNVGFLRPDAYLGIVILTNEDDCSATPPTPAYSLNGFQQNIANPDGPIANYRCNGGPHGAHRCQDPNNGNTWMVPPLLPPPDAQGPSTAPTLDLANCQDNEAGGSFLRSVGDFVNDVKMLKPDPDHQILVAAITAPPAPYTVKWFPASQGQNTQPGELWPQVLHSCGAVGNSDVNPNGVNATDGSFGDPGVRITQFVNSFQDSVIASICDPDYSRSMTAIATKLKGLLTPPCITDKLQNDAQGNPACTVTENLTDSSNHTTRVAIPNCNENGNTAPCWKMVPGTMGCTGQTIQVNDTAANMMATSENSTVQCSICLPGVSAPGC
jgi:hypothetical protein